MSTMSAEVVSGAEVLINQPTMRPTRKVAQGTIAGGLTVGAVTPFIILIFNRVYDNNIPDDAYNVLPYLSAAAVWVIQSIRGYIAKDRAATEVVVPIVPTVPVVPVIPLPVDPANGEDDA